MQVEMSSTDASRAAGYPSYAHACRALFSVPRADRQLDYLSLRAHALLDQKPKAVAGRQGFLRDLVRAAQDGSIKPLTKTEIQHIFPKKFFLAMQWPTATCPMLKRNSTG